jgi:hypothetical protein
VLRRSRLLVSAARLLAREASRADLEALPKLEAVPSRGVGGGRRRGAAAGLVVHYGLYAALAATVVAFFLPAIERLDRGQTLVELVVGVVLTAEGGLLVSNWHGARWRLVRRRVERSERRRGGPGGGLDAVRWRLFGYALFGLGLAWLAVGVVVLGQAIVDR